LGGKSGWVTKTPPPPPPDGLSKMKVHFLISKIKNQKNTDQKKL